MFLALASTTVFPLMDGPKNVMQPLNQASMTMSPTRSLVFGIARRVPSLWVSTTRTDTLVKKDTSVTFWAERNFFCHTYDTSMTIIVTKHGIIIDVAGSYFYDIKS